MCRVPSSAVTMISLSPSAISTPVDVNHRPGCSALRTNRGRAKVALVIIPHHMELRGDAQFKQGEPEDLVYVADLERMPAF